MMTNTGTGVSGDAIQRHRSTAAALLRRHHGIGTLGRWDRLTRARGLRPLEQAPRSRPRLRRETRGGPVQVIEEEGLQANSAAVGDRLLAGMHALAEKHDIIGHVRGAGLMLGMELVKDRSTKVRARTRSPPDPGMPSQQGHQRRASNRPLAPWEPHMVASCMHPREATRTWLRVLGFVRGSFCHLHMRPVAAFGPLRGLGASWWCLPVDLRTRRGACHALFTALSQRCLRPRPDGSRRSVTASTTSSADAAPRECAELRRDTAPCRSLPGRSWHTRWSCSRIGTASSSARAACTATCSASSPPCASPPRTPTSSWVPSTTPSPPSRPSAFPQQPLASQASGALPPSAPPCAAGSRPLGVGE